jgi:hypothetical protein
MKSLVIILTTATVTFFATNIWARADRDEKYASLLWAHCPQLIQQPHHTERALIEFLDGAFVPIRPRPKPVDGQQRK